MTPYFTKYIINQEERISLLQISLEKIGYYFWTIVGSRNIFVGKVTQTCWLNFSSHVLTLKINLASKLVLRSSSLKILNETGNQMAKI